MISWIRKRLEEREEGFTLIELLVVVIIIGILAAIAIPVFLNQRERAWVASVESDLRNAAIDIETFYAENDEYPTTVVAGVDAADPVTVYVQLSDGTELADGSADGVTYTLDAAPAQAYCLAAAHSNLTGVVASYDSDGGGLMDVATADCSVAP